MKFNYIIPTTEDGKSRGIATLGGTETASTVGGDGRTLDLRFQKTLLNNGVIATTQFSHSVTGKTQNENLLRFSENFNEFAVRNPEYLILGGGEDLVPTDWSWVNVTALTSSLSNPLNTQGNATYLVLGNTGPAFPNELRINTFEVPVNIASPNQYTFSIYVKMGNPPTGGGDFITTQPYRVRLYMFAFSETGPDPEITLADSTFDIDQGIIEAFVYANTSSIQNVGNGWYRVSITVSNETKRAHAFLDGAKVSCRIRVLPTTSPNVQGIYIFGAQLSGTTAPIPYVKSEHKVNVAPFNGYTVNRERARTPLTQCRPINALYYSENLSISPWIAHNYGPTNTVLRTANFAQSPEGTITATRIRLSLGSTETFYDPDALSFANSRCGVYQRPGGGFAVFETSNISTNLKTFSIWLKSQTGATYTVALGNHFLYKITVGPEWKKYSIQANSTNFILTGSQVGCGIFLIGNSETDKTVDILAWGAQLTLDSSKENPYVATTNTFTYEAPIDYDPLSGELRGLRLEPAATNLLTDSLWTNPFINWSSLFTYQSGTFPQRTAIAALDAPYPIFRSTSMLLDNTLPPEWQEPRGQVLQCANYFMEHGVKRSVSLTAGTRYTFSIYVSPLLYGIDALSPPQYLNFIMGAKEDNSLLPSSAVNTAVRARFIVNPNPDQGLSFGALGTTTVISGATGTTSSIERVGQNVWRCSVSFVADTTDVEQLIIAVEKDGIGVTFLPQTSEAGMAVAAPQLEVGPKATSFIGTIGAPRTRPATEYKFLSSSGNWLTSSNPSSAVIDFKCATNALNPTIFKIGTNDNSQFIALNQSGTSTLTLTTVVDGPSGVQTSQAASNLAFNNYHGFGYSLNVGAYLRSLNGSTVTSTNLNKAQQVSAQFETLSIGTTTFDGWIRRIIFFPTNLTQQQLNSLTTVTQIGAE